MKESTLLSRYVTEAANTPQGLDALVEAAKQRPELGKMLAAHDRIGGPRQEEQVRSEDRGTLVFPASGGNRSARDRSWKK